MLVHITFYDSMDVTPQMKMAAGPRNEPDPIIKISEIS